MTEQPTFFKIAAWAEEYVFCGMPSLANLCLRYLVQHALVGGKYLDPENRHQYGDVDGRYSPASIIAQQTGLGESTVRKVMNDLESRGFISRQRTSKISGETTSGNPYTVSLMPLIQRMFEGY